MTVNGEGEETNFCTRPRNCKGPSRETSFCLEDLRIFFCTQLMMVDLSRAAAMLFVPSAESAYRISLKNAHDIHPETLFL